MRKATRMRTRKWPTRKRNEAAVDFPAAGGMPDTPAAEPGAIGTGGAGHSAEFRQPAAGECRGLPAGSKESGGQDLYHGSGRALSLRAAELRRGLPTLGRVQRAQVKDQSHQLLRQQEAI